MRMLFVLIPAMLLFACHGTGSKTTTPSGSYFITGVYAAFEKARFCTAWDTLVVIRDKTQSNHYLIRRLSCFQRNIGNIFFPVERACCEWTGLYDNVSQMLNGITRRAAMEFFPQLNELRLEGATYSRVE